MNIGVCTNLVPGVDFLLLLEEFLVRYRESIMKINVFTYLVLGGNSLLFLEEYLV